MRFKKVITGVLISLVVIGSQAIADITSYDNTFVANDVYSSDFHTRLNQNFSKSLTGGINNITTQNIKDGTLASGDFSQSVSPVTRTYEGAACEFVYSGLLPVTSANLTTDTTLGTAYPRGYRCEKASSTSHTYTASKWTYVDIDQNCDFQYTEVAIDASAPSVAGNSIRLARVSSDGVTINTVTDLRKTSCASGPFNKIADVTGEATLSDILSTGSPVTAFGENGYIQGLNVSWDTHTTFKVKKGVAYINGKYRLSSVDLTVTSATDNPITGGSGIDSGSPAASTAYNVFAVADQDTVDTLSITYSTLTVPAGVTNYRKIGQITTDASSLFSSSDIVRSNSIMGREIVGAYIYFDSYTNAIFDSYNISALADNGVGDFTFSFDQDFASRDYVVFASGKETRSTAGTAMSVETVDRTNSTYRANLVRTDTSGTTDAEEMNLIFFGDKER